MRILLAHNSTYYPSQGGGDKSNRLLMEALAERGHAVRVVTRVETFGERDHAEFLTALQVRDVPATVGAEDVRFDLHGVAVYTLTRSTLWRPYFQGQIDEFDPEVIVTSTDDPAQLLFDLAIRAPRARVVYLIRATIAVPFGPDSSGLHEERTAALRRADGVVGVSHYVAGYARQWGGLDAIHVPISLLEPGESPLLGRFDNPYVLMVNPCAVKGISILLGLADAMPEVRFGAVASWGTTTEDLAALRARPNIELLPRRDQIDDLLRDARATLVPSIWAEARSRMVIESLSRGVPVLGADVGGLKEAMLGVPYLLPVNPITSYAGTVDEHMVPVAAVPPQDIGPWVEALRRLTSDRAHWEKISNFSREKALQYLESVNVLPFEAYCRSLLEKPKRGPAAKAEPAGPLAGLSPEKRRLLELRRKQKAQSTASPWLPNLPARGPRLFVFPFAGGGALAWRGAPPELNVAPVRLPGRESRAAEPAFTRMEELIPALLTALRPHLDEPFAFFGHSMGAGIAFELTRALVREGAPLPKKLIVSAARAPRYRLGWTPPPEPAEEQLLAELRRLDGIPADVLERPELLALALPVLRADTRLYRGYVYHAGPALPVPIAAYGGESDPNVRPEHLDAWAEQSLTGFTRRQFPGGHFYLQADPAALWAAVRQDLG